LTALMGKPPVIVLDACVLYPAAQRDLFMWLAAGGVVRAHWTDDIHPEWINSLRLFAGTETCAVRTVPPIAPAVSGVKSLNRSNGGVR
jgi:hypothetical protein